MATWTNQEVRIYEQTRALKSAEVRQKMASKADVVAEKELHRQIEQWLRMRGVRCIVHSRTDKRTTQAKGVPDFLFVAHTQPYAIEVKVGTNTLTSEQELWLSDAALDGWHCRVVRSLDDVIAFVPI